MEQKKGGKGYETENVRDLKHFENMSYPLSTVKCNVIPVFLEDLATCRNTTDFLHRKTRRHILRLPVIFPLDRRIFCENFKLQFKYFQSHSKK